MESILIRLINMSIAAACMAFAVMALRLVFRRVPRRSFVVLWGLVALRLIFPFAVQSSFSLVPDTRTFLKTEADKSGSMELNPEIPRAADSAGQSDHILTQGRNENKTPATGGAAAEWTGEAAADNAARPGVSWEGDQNSFAAKEGNVVGDENAGNVQSGSLDGGSNYLVQAEEAGIGKKTDEGQSGNAVVMKGTEVSSGREPETAAAPWIHISGFVWAAGLAIMLVYMAVNTRRVRRKVREAVHDRDNIWRCDHLGTSFILGIFRPRIYLPTALAEPERDLVLQHEQIHLRRRDHIWKAVGFVLVALHWFNPIIWLSFILFCRDIEFACDETVIRDLGDDLRTNYADALINSSVQRGTLTAPPAFAEANVKSRVEHVLKYRKAPAWMAAVVMTLCLALAGCFMTDPESSEITGTSLPEAETSSTEEEKMSVPAETGQQSVPAEEGKTDESAAGRTTEAAAGETDSVSPADAPQIYVGDYFPVFWNDGAGEEQFFAMDRRGELILDRTIPEKLTDAITGEPRYYTVSQYEQNDAGHTVFTGSWLYDTAGNPIDRSDDCVFGPCIGELVVKYDYRIFESDEEEGRSGDLEETMDPDKSTWLYDPTTKTVLMEGVFDIMRLSEDRAILLGPGSRLICAVNARGGVAAKPEADLEIFSVMVRDGFISAVVEDAGGLEYQIIMNSGLQIMEKSAGNDNMELIGGCPQGALVILRSDDNTVLVTAADWGLVGTFPKNLRQTDGICVICGDSGRGNFSLYDMTGSRLAGLYDGICLLGDEDGQPSGEYLARKGEDLRILDRNGTVLRSCRIEGLKAAGNGEYGRIVCTYEWEDTDGTVMESRVICDGQLNRLTKQHYEHIIPVTEGIWLGENPGADPPCQHLLNEKEQIILYELDEVFGGDEQVIAVRSGYDVGLVDHKGNWITKTELPVEKGYERKIRLGIRDFCETLYGSMLKDSTTTFGWDDFDSIEGYMVAKSVETMRATEMLDGTGVTEVEVLPVRLQGGPARHENGWVQKAIVGCGYVNGGERTEWGSCYLFTLKEEGDGYRVTDLSALDDRNITDLRDSLRLWMEECKDVGDKWQFAAVDRIMEQRKESLFDVTPDGRTEASDGE